MESTGSLAHISEAKRIESNINHLRDIAAIISEPQLDPLTLYGHLKDARTLAVQTYSLLKRYQAFVNSSDIYEKSQRKVTLKELKLQYQNALRNIDTVAQITLGNSNRKQISSEIPLSNFESDTNQSCMSCIDDYKSYDERGRSKFEKNNSFISNYDELEDYHKTSQPLNYKNSWNPFSAFNINKNVTRPIDTHNSLLMDEHHKILNDVQGIRNLYKKMGMQVLSSTDDLDQLETQMRSANEFSRENINSLVTSLNKINRQRKINIMIFTFVLCFIIILWFFP